MRFLCRFVASSLVTALLFLAGSTWADSYVYKGVTYTYNNKTLVPGDTKVGLNSAAFGGAESFPGVLRQSAVNNGVAVILLHGRGNDYRDGYVVLPLRLALNDLGYTTFSIDIPAALPQPSFDTDYADYQTDAGSGGANYVFPELYARIRAAETKLQSLGAKQAVLIGFSLGSRFGVAFERYGATGVLPIIGYIGVGMGSDDVVPRLDSPTSLLGVKVPVLDLYGSADDSFVLSGVAQRKSNYSGPSYTQIMQAGSTHQWIGYEAQLVGYVQPWVTQLVASASSLQVVEFYNTNLDNYFITADANEAAAIDSGSAGPGWIRTGHNFGSGGSTSVCRFYGSQSPGPNSHFYTVDPAECQSLKDQQFPAGDPRKLTVKSWNFESLDFASTPAANQLCPGGTVPVFRAYNNGFARGVDSNHRITSSLTAIQEVVARGWSNEGVVMCAPL